MCVLIFSTTFVWKFLIPRIIERDMMKMYIGIHVPIIVLEFNETWSFWTYF
jgi:hypothetical protein